MYARSYSESSRGAGRYGGRKGIPNEGKKKKQSFGEKRGVRKTGVVIFGGKGDQGKGLKKKTLIPKSGKKRRKSLAGRGKPGLLKQRRIAS